MRSTVLPAVEEGIVVAFHKHTLLPPTYNFAKRLKALKGLKPFEFICDVWKKNRKDSG